MPLYDYECDRRHVTESRQGVDVASIPCPRCGRCAARAGVYRGQYIQAETGPKGGKKNEVPFMEQKLGRDVSEFVEAMGEVNDAYAKADAEAGYRVKRAPIVEKAKAAARARQVKGVDTT
jgi:hypothetical protein